MSSRQDARRQHLADTLEGIDGFLDINEAWQLHECARQRALAVSDPCVVEIGSWKGRSAIALALGLRAAGKGGVVHAIDPHLHDTQAGLEANLDCTELRDAVQVVTMFSYDARPRFADGSVDVLFVDGSHDYDDVMADLEGWTSALRDGAVIAFNDPGWAGVYGVLRARTARVQSPFRRPWFSSNTVFYEYRPNAPWTVEDRRRMWRLHLFLLVKRRLEIFWQWSTPRLPDRGMVLLGMGAWGLTRALLRTSPYGPLTDPPSVAVT